MLTLPLKRYSAMPIVAGDELKFADSDEYLRKGMVKFAQL
jgi:hypothetical protein